MRGNVYQMCSKFVPNISKYASAAPLERVARGPSGGLGPGPWARRSAWGGGAIQPSNPYICRHIFKIFPSILCHYFQISHMPNCFQHLCVYFAYVHLYLKHNSYIFQHCSRRFPMYINVRMPSYIYCISLWLCFLGS